MRLFINFSELLGQGVVDAGNRGVGALQDIFMHANDEVFPRVAFFIVRKGFWLRRYASILPGDVRDIAGKIELKVDSRTIKFQRESFAGEFSLCRHILDQQVVDTNDQKVVRVNDVHLLHVDNQLYLAHVDVGLRGLIRRLGWERLVDGCVRLCAPECSYLHQEEFISWKNVHVLAAGRMTNVIRSDVARKKLARIPAAELADIMEDLNVFEKLSFFKTFNADMQRRVFADMTPQEKGELIDYLTDEETGSLLENIPADEATDLLHSLSKEKAIQLMRHMHSETSKKLRRLLGFARDRAGGLMTTEYLSVGEEARVKDAIQKLKENADYLGNIFFVYLVDPQNRLVGMTSLRRFINEDTEKPLIETCYPKEIFVRTDDGLEEVALLLEKYKFSSIPVLSDDGILQGVITIDDILEELISLAWKKYKDQL
jgi:CBS domain-containing protein/uncharacterized protein YrrD